MRGARVWVAVCCVVLILSALAAYAYIHKPFASDPAEVLAVPLSQDNPALDQVGDLRFMGGLDIPRTDQNVGGLSGLRWDANTCAQDEEDEQSKWQAEPPVEFSHHG